MVTIGNTLNTITAFTIILNNHGYHNQQQWGGIFSQLGRSCCFDSTVNCNVKTLWNKYLSKIGTTKFISNYRIVYSTPPLKNINIFDMSYWNSILDSKIWASLTKNLLKTKNSVGGFSRKSKKDLSNNVSANFEKSPQRIFFVSIIWWSGRPKIWFLAFGLYRTCQKC